MKRKEQLNEIFKEVDKKQKELIEPLIDEIIFLEIQMREIKKLPFIRVHPHNCAIQEITKAGKLYKEYSQSYVNDIKILLSVLQKESGDEEDPVQKFLEIRKNV